LILVVASLFPRLRKNFVLSERTSKKPGKNAVFVGRTEFSGKIASEPGEFRE
jgi:hypothetical protein